MTTQTVWFLLPEIVLIVAAIGIILGGAFAPAWRRWNATALAAIIAAGWVLWTRCGASTDVGRLTADPLSAGLRWLALAAGGLLVLTNSTGRAVTAAAEYTGLLLLAVSGLMLVADAPDVIFLFVSLELISIPTYVLLYLGRRDPDSREAAIKYFFLSVLASAMLLYGLSFLYGVAGTTELAEIRKHLDTSLVAPGFEKLPRLALVLVVAGLGLKITAFPFHFYAPDVYQGTNYVNAALLSVLPKAAGLVALVRIVLLGVPGLEPYAWRIAMLLAVLTMTFGNVLALWQDNVRRLMAYSSMAHTGYLLVGLAVGLAAPKAAPGWDGTAAMLFYLAIYALATMGAFAGFNSLSRRDRAIDNLNDLAGLGRSRPWTAAWIAVCMFSLAGVPPLGGFWGKLLLFGSALKVDVPTDAMGEVQRWFVGLAVVGVLNAAIGAAYYLRVVSSMYFSDCAEVPALGSRASRWAATICAILVLLVGCYPGPLMHQAQQASPTAAQEGDEGGISSVRNAK